VELSWVVVPARDGSGSTQAPPAVAEYQPERGPDPDVRRLYARALGGRSPLRPPDATLESQDAPLHLHRAGRYLHHRLAADAAAARGGARVCAQPRRTRR